MKRFAALAVLSLALCIAGAQNARAGVCFTWTDYGWSACKAGVADEDACIDIALAGDWDHYFYTEQAGCKCYDNLAYYRKPVTWEGETFPAIHRWVVVSWCRGTPEEGEWSEAWDFGEAWSNVPKELF